MIPEFFNPIMIAVLFVATLLCSLCTALSEEIQTIDNHIINSEQDLNPLVRQERDYYANNYGHPGSYDYENGLYGNQQGMHNMGYDQGYYGNQHMPLRGMGMMHDGGGHYGHGGGGHYGHSGGGHYGHGGGMLHSHTNPLNALSNLLGSGTMGRATNNFQKDIIPPLLPNDVQFYPSLHQYSGDMYPPHGCPCMGAVPKSSEPVASYILSAPMRRKHFYY